MRRALSISSGSPVMLLTAAAATTRALSCRGVSVGTTSELLDAIGWQEPEICLASGDYPLDSQLTLNTSVNLSVAVPGTAVLRAKACSPGSCTVCRRVVLVGGTASVVLSGLVITDGEAKGCRELPTPGQISHGGGVLNLGSATLISSTIANNSAPNGGGVANSGGGILRLIDSRVVNNTAVDADGWGTDGQGGGVLSRNGVVHLVDSHVLNNSAEIAGGGVQTGGEFMSIFRSVISGNNVRGGSSTCPWDELVTCGGGGVDHFASSLTIDATEVSYNRGGQGGGGVFTRGDGQPSPTTASLSVLNSVFMGNTANWGGGVYNRAVSTYVDNTTFTSNEGTGGAGFYNYGKANATIKNSALIGNRGVGVGNKKSYWWDDIGGPANLTLINSVVTNSTGADISNDGIAAYVLPMPLGYYLEGVIQCSIAMCCPASGCSRDVPEVPCPIQSCDAAHSGKLVKTLDQSEYNDMPSKCSAGSYGNSTAGLSQATASCAGQCPAGHICPEAGTVEPVPVPAGSYAGVGSREASQCPLGHFCAARTTFPTPCPAGTLGDIRGLSSPACNGPCPLGRFCERGSAAAHVCADGTHGNRTGLASAAECAPCPPGKWCNSGRAVPCEVGLYADDAPRNRTSLDACKSCGARRTTLAQATSSEVGCACMSDSFEEAPGTATCSDCPHGAVCQLLRGAAALPSEGRAVGTTLSTLQAQRGFWRPTTRTPTFRACRYDTCGGAARAGDELCRDGFRGPYCELCVPNRTYLVGSPRDVSSNSAPAGNASGGVQSAPSSRCEDCPEPVTYVVAVVALLVAVLSLWWGCVWWARRRSRRVDASARHSQQQRLGGSFASTFALRALDFAFTFCRSAGTLANDNRTKFKILWTFYSITTHIKDTYNARYPPVLDNIMTSFSKVLSLNIPRLIPGLRLRCFDPLHDLSAQLAFAIVAPLVLYLGLLAGMRLFNHSVSHAMHGFLGWSFLVYPMVVSMGFNCLKECECFENLDGSRTCFLRYDLEVECPAPAERPQAPRRITDLAWVAICLYGVGVPLCYLIILLRHRHEIRAERPLVGSSGAISLLFAEYQPRVFFWEVVETLKKLVLGGLLVQLHASTTEWLFLAIIVSFVVLMLQFLVVPYKTQTDNLLGTLSAMMLVLVFISTFALQGPQQSWDGGGGGDRQSLLVFFATLGATLFLLLVTIVTFVHSVRTAMAREASRKTLPKLRWRLGDGQRFACFLSHYKAEAAAEARYLKDSLEEVLGVPVFLDSSNLGDLRELFSSGVHVSEVFVLLLTEQLLTRPWCLLEVHEAARHGKRIVPLALRGPTQRGAFDFDAAFELLSDLEANLPPLNPYALDELRAHLGGTPLSELATTVRVALEAARAGHRVLPSLNLSSTTNQLEAQLVDLVDCLVPPARRAQLVWSHEGGTSTPSGTASTAGAAAAGSSHRRGSFLRRGLAASQWQPAHLLYEPAMEAHARRLQGGLNATLGHGWCSTPQAPTDHTGDRGTSDHRGTVADTVAGTVHRLEALYGARCLLLLQTPGVLAQPWTWLALYQASIARVPLVCVLVEGAGYEFEAARHALHRLDAQLEPVAMDEMRRVLARLSPAADVATLQATLEEVLPSLISVNFRPEGTDTELAATARDVDERRGAAVHALEAKSGRESSFRSTTTTGASSADSGGDGSFTAGSPRRVAVGATVLQRLRIGRGGERRRRGHGGLHLSTASLLANQGTVGSPTMMHETAAVGGQGVRDGDVAENGL